MKKYQQVYAAFMESVCNKFNCREALPALNKGFRAFCEASDTDYDPFDIDTQVAMASDVEFGSENDDERYNVDRYVGKGDVDFEYPDDHGTEMKDKIIKDIEKAIAGIENIDFTHDDEYPHELGLYFVLPGGFRDYKFGLILVNDDYVEVRHHQPRGVTPDTMLPWGPLEEDRVSIDESDIVQKVISILNPDITKWQEICYLITRRDIRDRVSKKVQRGANLNDNDFVTALRNGKL